MDQMDGTNRQLAGTWTLRLWDIFYFINTCNSDFWVAATSFLLLGASIWPLAQQMFVVCSLAWYWNWRIYLALFGIIWQQREQRYCQACRRSIGSIVLGDEIHSLSVCVRASEQRQAYNSIIGYFRAEHVSQIIQHNTLVDLFSSHHYIHVLSKAKQHLAWKQVAAVTAALQQSVRSELDTQDPSLTSGRNSWGINLWNRFPRQLRSMSASVWEDTQETCQLPQLPLRFLMILTK